MFKKKNKINYDRANGYVEGYLDAIDILKKQKFEYGDLASINDMISLLADNADVVLDKLLNRN